jgi:hypothetical protein
MIRATPHAALAELAANALHEPTAAAVRERARAIVR